MSLDDRVARNEIDIKTMWNAIDEIKKAMTYRLPLWATMFIAALSACLGFFVKN